MATPDIARREPTPPGESPSENRCPSFSGGRGNDCAEASRFQRFYIALSSILAVLFNDPRFIFPVTLSVLVVLLSSTRFEPSVVFYRHVVLRVLGGHPWPITPDAGAKYLLGDGPEKFVFAVMGLMLALTIYLWQVRFELWMIPLAAMAAGSSLAAVTGICLMGIVYMRLREAIFDSAGRTHV